MAYEKKVWENKPSKKTPITAEDLNHIEDGIFAVSEQSDQQAKNIQKNETDISNLKTKEEQNTDQLANLTQQKADVIILTESGKTIARTDTAESKLEGLTVFGHSDQKSYSGKNLCNVNNVTFQEYHMITLDNPLSAGTYWLSLNAVSDDTDSDQCLVGFGKDASAYIYIDCARNTRFKKQVALTDTSQYIFLYASNSFVNSEGDTAVFSDIMISTEDVAYEPYTGGVASPNPDYPQEVVSAGQKLVSGAQLWDSESESAYDNGRRYVFQCKANTDYTLSTDITVASLAVLFDGFINENTLAVKYNGNVVAFNSGQYTTLYLQIYNKDNPKDYNIMLNEGKNALPWEPYTGGVEKPYAVGIETRVYGKNLFDKEKASDINNWYINMHDIYQKGYYEMAIHVGKGNTVTVSYDKTLLPGNNLYAGVAFKTTESMLNWLYHYSETDMINKTLTLTSIEDYLYLRFYGDHDLFMQLIGDDLQFELGAIATPYEPYLTPQLLPCATPNGLPGIEVTDASLANYTDSDGKMWACDYRDWERGVDVKRIAEYVITGQEDVAKTNDDGNVFKVATNVGFLSSGSRYKILCTHYIGKYSNDPGNTYISGNNLVFSDRTITTAEEFKTMLAQKYENGMPVKVYGILSAPTETPIPEDELEAYRALHSNYPSTTIMNDAGCHMEAGMVADTKNYIDNKFAELKTALATTNAQLI